MADGYRLPREANWDHATHAGTRTIWIGTDDPSGIECLIEDPGLNEYVPTAAIGALEILFAIGELDRVALEEYLGRLARRGRVGLRLAPAISSGASFR